MVQLCWALSWQPVQATSLAAVCCDGAEAGKGSLCFSALLERNGSDMWSSWREWAPAALGSASLALPAPPGCAGTALPGAGPTLLIPLSWEPRGCRALGWCGVRRERAAGRWKASQPKGLSSLSRNYPGLSLLQLPVLKTKLNELSTSKLLNSHKGCPGLLVKAFTKHFPWLKEQNWANKSTSCRV